jgi:hypothetical protein
MKRRTSNVHGKFDLFEEESENSLRIVRVVIEESNRDDRISELSLVCFCLSPLSQTYDIRLSSITLEL